MSEATFDLSKIVEASYPKGFQEAAQVLTDFPEEEREMMLAMVICQALQM